MKLLTLRLIAYGPFTDHNIDFCSNAHSIQLLYGPNEAGKSATLRAITDLFYGIPERTNDNFIHENNALRIGARIIHSDDSYLEFTRRKGRKNTLLDDNEKILEEAIFDANIPKTEIVTKTITKFIGLIETGYAREGVIIIKENNF